LGRDRAGLDYRPARFRTPSSISSSAARSIQDVRETELGARRIAIEELVPLFWEAPGLASAFGRSGEYRLRGLEEVALPYQEVRLPNVPGLKNRLLLRRAWVSASVDALEQLKSQLVVARELLPGVEATAIQ
jgi:hypothetical protein